MDRPGYKPKKGQGNYQQRKGSKKQVAYLSHLADELGMDGAREVLAHCYKVSPANALESRGDMGSLMGAIDWAQAEIKSRKRASHRASVRARIQENEK
jgi:hypothetical protein